MPGEDEDEWGEDGEYADDFGDNEQQDGEMDTDEESYADDGMDDYKE